jgi:hypothetical protein
VDPSSLLLAAAGAMTPVAGAAVILGNLPPTNDNTQSAGLNDLRRKAFRFVTGTEDLEAGHLRLRLRHFDQPGELIVQLRDGGTTSEPGAHVLLSFVAPAPGGAAIGHVTLVPEARFVLEAETHYWLVALGVAGGSYDWMASEPGIVPVGLAVHETTRFTFDGGKTWVESSVLSSFDFLEFTNAIFADGFEPDS